MPSIERRRAAVAAPRAVTKADASAGKTFAAIDMGSSSAKLLVLRQKPRGGWETVVDLKEGTMLGKDIGADKVLPTENQERALKALRTFVAEAKKQGVPAEQVTMIATAVVRNTVNGKAFARRIHDELGLTPRVLTGEQEAEAGYLGAIAAFRKAGEKQRFASLDLGGGSFQLAIGDGDRMAEGASTQVGSNFVLEHYFGNERLSNADFARADRELAKTAPMPLSATKLKGRQLVATGGVSKFLRAHFGRDVISRDDIDALRRQVGAMSYQQRIALVQKGKAKKTREALGVDTAEGARDYGVKLPASATLLLRILDGLNVDEVRVSSTDARHALIAQAAA